MSRGVIVVRWSIVFKSVDRLVSLDHFVFFFEHARASFASQLMFRQLYIVYVVLD